MRGLDAKERVSVQHLRAAGRDRRRRLHSRLQGSGPPPDGDGCRVVWACSVWIRVAPRVHELLQRRPPEALAGVAEPGVDLPRQGAICVLRVGGGCGAGAVRLLKRRAARDWRSCPSERCTPGYCHSATSRVVSRLPFPSNRLVRISPQTTHRDTAGITRSMAGVTVAAVLPSECFRLRNLHNQADPCLPP